ncbi:MAG: teichoic acid export protein ATP-binding subunit, partial [Exiguobacterium sp.]
FLKWFRNLSKEQQDSFKADKLKRRTTVVDATELGETYILPPLTEEQLQTRHSSVAVSNEA